MRYLFLCLAFVACDAADRVEVSPYVSSDVVVVDNSVYGCLSTRVDEPGQPQFYFVTRDDQPIRRCTLGCDGKECLDPPVSCPGNQDTECDDKIPCTTDTCVNGRCEYSPDDSLCPRLGDTCAVEYGACTTYCFTDDDCDLEYGHECLESERGSELVSEFLQQKCDTVKRFCYVSLQIGNCGRHMTCVMTKERCVASE